MDQGDPEKRIAELERQLAEQQRTPAPEQQQAEAVTRSDVTPERVHNVAFSEASRSQGAYDRDEVDAFLDRLEATLRDPTAIGGVTPAEIDNAAFSKPPLGKMGYDEDEVDSFLDRVKVELARGVPGDGVEEAIRCLLYRLGSRDQQTPVLAIDVDKDAIRVIDLKSNALIGSASLGEVTAEPAHHGGGPVLVLGIPGLQPLTIRPHLEEGFSRRTQSGRLVGKVKSKKPDYFVTDADWLSLVEKFPVELPEVSTPRKIVNNLLRFTEEGRSRAPTTWRTPVVLGAILIVPGLIYWSPVLVVISVVLFVLAGVVYYFRWEL
jgi:DivIVA domain-containing protein